MKILCLIVILANIVLLMWEYRNGAFDARKATPEQAAIVGTEQIILSHEQKKESQPPFPAPQQLPSE